jgi:parallel beta-helix repeat protein
MNRKPLVIASAAVVAASVGLLLAGPLNPPSGPVAPTMKTLTEVEPRIAINATNTPGALGAIYKITQPGSYYLTGNVTSNFFNDAIQIACSNVTLDLNGFVLLGTGATGAADGVSVSGPCINVTIKNGSAQGWPGYGFKLDSAIDFRATDLSANGCGNNGFLASTGGTPSTNGGVFDNCVASNCAGSLGGFYVAKCRLSRCRAQSNANYGFYAENCQITDCTASDNQGMGFGASYSNVIGCHATGNSVGIFVGTGSTASACNAYRNHGTGFFADSQATITDCSATWNGDNTAYNYGGVAVVGSASRIEGCTASNNQNYGFSGNGANDQCLVVRNLAIHNSASPANNFIGFSTTNFVGPIVTTTGTITSTNPWANFSN